MIHVCTLRNHRQDIVIMDNLRAHKDERVRALIEQRGGARLSSIPRPMNGGDNATLRFLPP
jgi:hypothetical protein